MIIAHIFNSLRITKQDYYVGNDCFTVCWHALQCTGVPHAGCIGMPYSVLVRLTVYWYALQCTGVPHSVLVCLTVYWYALQSTGLPHSVLGCFTVYRYTLQCTG